MTSRREFMTGLLATTALVAAAPVAGVLDGPTSNLFAPASDCQLTIYTSSFGRSMVEQMAAMQTEENDLQGMLLRALVRSARIVEDPSMPLDGFRVAMS